MIKSIVIFEYESYKHNRKYSWPLNNTGTRGTEPLSSWKQECNFTLALYFLGSAFSNSTNLRSCNTNIFSIEKNQCISRPMQFKPVLFKDQLYSFDSKSNLFVVFVFVLTLYLILEYLRILIVILKPTFV